MPRLARLLPLQDGEAGDDTTAEQLFSTSIHAQMQRARRKQVAARCSAQMQPMSVLVAGDSDASKQRPVADAGKGVARMDRSVQQCVEEALQTAGREQRALFLVADPALVTKRLAVALSDAVAAMSDEHEKAAAPDCLGRVHFRRCCRVYDLLCELERAQQLAAKHELQLVVVGPLCELFSEFRTVTGSTSAAGAGLQRMVELALRRLRGTTDVRTCVMAPELG